MSRTIAARQRGYGDGGATIQGTLLTDSKVGGWIENLGTNGGSVGGITIETQITILDGAGVGALIRNERVVCPTGSPNYSSDQINSL